MCAGNLYGGVETFLETWVDFERSAGLESRFLIGWEGRHAEALRQRGAGVEIVGGARLSRPWQLLGVRRRLRESLRRNRPDLVVVHSGWTQWVMGPAARSLGIPLVLWVHNELPARSLLHSFARRVTPAGIVANSRFTASTVGSWYAQKVEVIYCPVPPPNSGAPGDRKRLRSELKTADDAFVLLQASRLQEWKGHRNALQALARLKDRTDWVWWIAGGAQRPEEIDYQQRLVREAEGLGIADHLRWLGHRADVAGLLNACDAYLQVNATPEPFGVAFMEALLAARPVVTADAGGIAEIVTDACGARVVPGNAPQLAGVLNRWMDDRELVRRLGAGGPLVAREVCDPAQQLVRIARVLKQIQSQAA
jgi:glycosyltransferase involved in cell wall biosynthesis